MMGRHVAAGFLIKEHEGKLDDPEEIELVVRNAQLAPLLQQARSIGPYATEDGTSPFPFGSGKEDEVAIFDIQAFL
jgi:hypothetical protein